jgi:hypothetical protein
MQCGLHITDLYFQAEIAQMASRVCSSEHGNRPTFMNGYLQSSACTPSSAQAQIRNQNDPLQSIYQPDQLISGNRSRHHQPHGLKDAYAESQSEIVQLQLQLGEKFGLLFTDAAHTVLHKIDNLNYG